MHRTFCPSLIVHLFRRYGDVQISLSYFKNLQSAESFLARKRFSKIGEKTDKAEWEMTAATCNAYYDPSLNQMVLPSTPLLFSDF